MAQFNEANSVRDFVRDLITSPDVQSLPGSQLPRRPDEVLLEGLVTAALIRLNPEIAADPRKADEVVHVLAQALRLAYKDQFCQSLFNMKFERVFSFRVGSACTRWPATTPPPFSRPHHFKSNSTSRIAPFRAWVFRPVLWLFASALAFTENRRYLMPLPSAATTTSLAMDASL